MNYQPKSNNRYKRPIQAAILVVVIGIVLRFAVPGPFDSFFVVVFAPLWRMEGAASAQEFFATHAALVSENARLEDELTALAPAEDSLALLEEENTELKSLLGRTPSDETFVLAAVLKSPPLAAYDSLIIDVGSSKGIESGDRVFAPVGLSSTAVSSSTLVSASSSAAVSSSSETGEVLAPIGDISETSAGTSKVELFSSSGMKYSVEIGPDHVPAEAVAQGGGMFSAQVAQGSDVNVGDPITIPDIETLTFGTVGAIVNDPTQPYTSVLFSEPVNIYQLRWVLVEKSQTVGQAGVK